MTTPDSPFKPHQVRVYSNQPLAPATGANEPKKDEETDPAPKEVEDVTDVTEQGAENKETEINGAQQETEGEGDSTQKETDAPTVDAARYITTQADAVENNFSAQPGTEVDADVPQVVVMEHTTDNNLTDPALAKPRFVTLTGTDDNPLVPIITSGPVWSPTDGTLASSIPDINHSHTDPSDPSHIPPQDNLVHMACGLMPNRKDMFCPDLPFGLFVAPLAPAKEAPPCLRRPSVRCKNCRSYINIFCKTNLSRGEWQCIFCSKTNMHPEEYMDERCAQFPEFTNEVVEYLDPTLQPYPVHPSSYSVAHIILIDANFTQENISALKPAIMNTLRSLPANTVVALLTFSDVISLYQLGLQNVASAEVFSGLDSVSADDMSYILRKFPEFFCRVQDCLSNIDKIFSALLSAAPRQRKTVQRRALGPAVNFTVSLLESFKDFQHKGSPKKTPKGGLLDVGTSSSPTNGGQKLDMVGGQITVFLGGTPNWGLGAMDGDTERRTGSSKNAEMLQESASRLYREMSLKCNSLNFRVDIFCCGLRNFNVPVLQNLVLSCGGTVYAQKAYDEKFPRTLLLNAHRVCGRNGSFSIQCSSSIAFTHIIGPAIIASSDSGGAAAGAPHYFRMGSPQARMCYSLFFKLREDVLDDDVYFQFVVKYTNWQNQCILRVITKRIPTTGNTTKFLESIDQGVTSTLLAKKVILLSRKVDSSDDVVEHLDNILGNIVHSYGEKQSGQFRLPESITNVPRILYLLRRGPMLAPILQHPDDIDIIRCAFLNSTYDDSLRCLSPPLYLVTEEGTMTQLPIEDLALQSEFVLLFDHHTDIFIYVGLNATKVEERIAVCTEFIRQTTKYRLPQPRVLSFREGSSMARCLQCRLIPSHKDSPEEQKQSFPALAALPEEKYKALLAQFHHTDEITFNQYLRQIYKTA